MKASMMFALGLLLVACTATGPAAPVGPGPAEPVAREPAPPPPAPAAPAAATDDEFKAAVRQVAAGSARYIDGWGTVRLDGSRQPYRVAALRSMDNDADEATAAYLVELAPRKLWSVAFHEDGRTSLSFGGGGEAGAEPAWQVAEEPRLQFLVGHRGGGESITFAVREGELVVLAHHYEEDVRDGGDAEIDDDFAPDGTCTTCPALAGFPSEEAELTVTQVSWPAGTLDHP